jgi:hypothetical protein
MAIEISPRTLVALYRAECAKVDRTLDRIEARLGIPKSPPPQTHKSAEIIEFPIERRRKSAAKCGEKG